MNMLAARLARLLLACLLTVLAPSVRAHEHIVERGWFEDPSGKLGLAEVARREFKPYEGFLGRGYGNSAVWVRLRIDPTLDPDFFLSVSDRLVLRVRPSYLDRIELFDPLDESARPALAGDRHPIRADSYRSLNPNFIIPRGDGPRVLYMRLETSSSRTMAVEALSFEDALRQDRWQEMYCGVYLAVLLVFLIWAMLHWIVSRDPLVGVFALKQALALLCSLLLLGYARAIPDVLAPAPVFLDTLTNVAIFALTSASAYFDYRLLREYHPPRWASNMQLALVALLPMNLALMLAGQTGFALSINMGAMLFAATWNVMVVTLSRPATGGDAPVIRKWVLVCFYLIIAATLSVAVGMLTGAAASNDLATYTLMFQALLAGTIMVFFIQVRAWRLGQRQALAVNDLILANESAYRDRVYREDLERLLEEIRQLAFHDSLTRLPNRRLLLEHLQMAMAGNRRNSGHGALMFLDLDDFKKLNDAHGHAVGDLLLIEVASRLRNCVRETDTVARFGGDEFVVVLADLAKDAVIAREQAAGIAMKMLVALAEPYRLTLQDNAHGSVVEHCCTSSIGVRMFDRHDESVEDLLDQADAAMYVAKDAGRNSIRFHA